MRKTGLVAIALIFISATLYWFTHKSDNANARYITSPLHRSLIEAKVSATGTLSPIVSVTVGSQVSGRVATLHADFNTRVKKGQVIATLDHAMFTAALEQANAGVLAAEGNLAKAKAQAFDAKRQAQRSGDLAQQKLVAQADADTAEANSAANAAAVKAAEGQLALARASRTQAEINLRYTTITSPINGVVTVRSIDVGQTVAATMTAPVLFQIAEDLKKMQVDTSVSESDVGKVKDGMNTTFTVDAYPGERFSGKVRQVRNAPTTVQNVVTYNTVIDVENGDLRLKPGMTANVSFVYAQAKDVLTIPSAALRFQMSQQNREPGKREHRGVRSSGKEPRSIWVLRGTGPKRVDVKLGISDGSVVEIVGGDVSEGDAIITEQISDDAKSPAPGSMARPPRGM